MGGGYWTRKDFERYAKVKGRSVSADGVLDSLGSAQETFAGRKLDEALDPYGMVRECRDSKEHPQTVPVILALDVTGSMGKAAVEVAGQLNVIMTGLFEKVKDVEFLVMGIGDLAYDAAPIQASQFESDIRIAEQLDKVYFEGGGGGNGFESYTAAWYFGLYHTDLDCWKRGKKGIIITMGDEALNPYLPKKGRRKGLADALGDPLETDIETDDLYEKATDKFHIYHLAVNDPKNCYRRYQDTIQATFGKLLDEAHFRTVTVEDLAAAITGIITEVSDAGGAAGTQGMVAW